MVTDPGLFFVISTVITLTGGTMFLMWLGEQITQRGIGNGISLIIMSGIVAQLPSAVAGTLELGRQGALSTGLILIVLVMAVAVVTFIVFMERAQRRLLIQYPKRQVGNQMFEGSPRICRSSSIRRASFRRSSPPRCCCCRRRSPTSPPAKGRAG